MKTYQKHSRFAVARKWLIFWTLFIGIGAVAGATGMLMDPTGKAMGMDTMLPYFQVLPFADVLFRDYIFSGISLLIVNGLTNLTAAFLLLKHKNSGVFLGGLFGVTLMLWICIQFYVFPLNFMSTAYFVFGLAQAATGYAAWVFDKQERFTVDLSRYPNIGTNPKHLVVYFSRMGYVKKAAYEEADRTGAQLYEVKATQRTEETAGFWWCGRYGMHRWDMPIEPISIDLLTYEQVTLCASVWVLHLCAPMRTFCRQAKGRIKSADLILLHHNASRYPSVLTEAETLLGIRCTQFRSIVCRKGIMKER